MNLHTFALRAAVAATVLWILKAVAIGVAGGLDRSPLEDPLYLTGLLAAVLAALTLGASYAERRPLPWKLLGGVLGFVVVAAYGIAVEAVVAALSPTPRGWVSTELSLWVLSAGLLAACLLRTRTDAPAPVREAARTGHAGSV